MKTNQNSQIVYLDATVGGGGSCQSTSNTAMCVAPGTRITLFPDGCAFAGDIQVGDLLLTRDEQGAFAGEKVVRVAESVQPCAAIETENGKRMVCSLTHEVMISSGEGALAVRRRVSELTIADSMLLEDGTRVAIHSIAPMPAGPVVQISLAGPHHVYLTDGIWSHNKTIPPWPPWGITP